MDTKEQQRYKIRIQLATLSTDELLYNANLLMMGRPVTFPKNYEGGVSPQFMYEQIQWLLTERDCVFTNSRSYPKSRSYGGHKNIGGYKTRQHSRNIPDFGSGERYRVRAFGRWDKKPNGELGNA